VLPILFDIKKNCKYTTSIVSIQDADSILEKGNKEKLFESSLKLAVLENMSLVNSIQQTGIPEGKFKKVILFPVCCLQQIEPPEKIIF